MKISATIMAAGKSSRMAGENKLLLRYGQSSIIRSICETVIASRFHPIMVITGFEKEKIEVELSELKIQLIYNPDWEEGMATSINTGIAALPKEIDGNLISLGDMPLIGGTILEKLKGAFDSNSGKRIIYPLYNDHQGNPVIFPRKYFDKILSTTGDRGCKKILKHYPENAIGVPVSSKEVVLDCDTPDDYLKLNKHDQDLHVSA